MAPLHGAVTLKKMNAVTVLTAAGFVRAAAATWWAVGAIGISVAITLAVFMRGRVLPYPVPVVWGLFAVFVAERSDRPPAAWFALVAALLVAAVVWRASSSGRNP